VISGSIHIDPKTGKWRARYRLDGRHRSWTPDPQPRNQRQADRVLAEYLKELENGEQVVPAKDVVAALAERWYVANKVNWTGNTPRSYRSLIDARILPALGSVKVQKLTVDDVEACRDRWMVELPRNTASRLMWLLQRILDLGMKRGLLHRNVAALAVRPKEERRERQIPAIEWVEAELRPVLEKRGELAWPFLLMYETGLRSGELRRKTDVDLNARVLYVRQSVYWDQDGRPMVKPPKTRTSERMVPLTERALSLIKRQSARIAKRQLKDRLWVDNGLFFPGRHGLPMRGSTLLLAWYQLQDEAGMSREQRIDVHDLRHLANTAMERAGVTPERRAKILGHSKIQITVGTYTHYDQQTLREVAETMNRSRRSRRAKTAGDGA